MNDLISRQAALDIIDSELNGWLTDDERLHLEGVGTGIECLPTIDPVKHGKWVVKEKVYPDLPNDSDYRYECSLCGWEDQHNEKMIVPYCWHCGARME